MTAFQIGNHNVPAGTRRTVDLPISVLANHTPMTLPVHVIHGASPGPVFFISAVVHGDEILGVEIVQRVVADAALQTLSGTILAVPIVNTFGFLNNSRYMPDRRDLNRSFPGSDHGSLASLLADLFLKEVVLRAQYGIDIHTAALHRTNLPQIRITPDHPELLAMAEAFAPPVIMVSKLRDGTLRQCARDRGVQMLLYEGGEALRFNEVAIDVGVTGVLNVLKHLGMITLEPRKRRTQKTAISTSSGWLRAPEGGILRGPLPTGTHVSKGQTVGEICNPLGDISVPVTADHEGIIIGRTNLPIVNRGDALFHVARMDKSEAADIPLFDEDEII